jgi:putative hemolysin
MQFFMQGKFSNAYSIEPRFKYKFFYSREYSQPVLQRELHEFLPPLINSYLNAGAQIHSAPAYDKDFQCADFFTILDLEQLSPKFARKYFSKED